MNSTNTFLLESKLRRLKISFSKENDKIIIGKSRVDFVVVFGLIILPIVIALSAMVFVLTSQIEFTGRGGGKIFGIIIFILAIGIVNIFRERSKMKANKNKKILDHKIIKIVDDFQIQRFEATNVKDFEYVVNHLDNDICQGQLFLVDSNNQKHLLLGFDGENEQYVLDDLYWFIDYFKKHLEL